MCLADHGATGGKSSAYTQEALLSPPELGVRGDGVWGVSGLLDARAMGCPPAPRNVGQVGWEGADVPPGWGHAHPVRGPDCASGDMDSGPFLVLGLAPTVCSF